MGDKIYVFQCISDRTLEMPISSDSAYNAVQSLKTLTIETTNWRLIKIKETTSYNRSISSIERDYKARQPKYRRDK